MTANSTEITHTLEIGFAYLVNVMQIDNGNLVNFVKRAHMTRM